MIEGNYSRFCGKNNDWMKKIQFCAQVAEEVISRETKSQRDAKNVLSKIQQIERSLKDAHMFATSEAGADIKENDEGTFTTAVKRKCPYYYDLVDIMSDRTSSRPLATSYENSDSEEQMEEQAEEAENLAKGSDVSDISEDEGAASRSIGTKRTTVTSATGSGSKRTKRKKYLPLLDSEALDALQQASKTSQEKMTELDTTRFSRVSKSVSCS